MPRFTKIQKELLSKYTRAIVHIRKRLAEGKFSLVFGAGISKDFGIPTWSKLVVNIAKDKEVNGAKLLEKNKDRPQGSKTQVLFHHFAAKFNATARGKALSYGEVKNQWRNIVRKHLYKKGKKIQNIQSEHPYIGSFMDIIRRTAMTINYNFDDYLEQILQRKFRDRRTFETIWNPQLQTKLDKCVIYHPNGFLPRNKMERQSEGLVFCEDEFADQLIESMAGRYASLLHHYCQNTCLFIGLSLEDNTLKHLLRQSARLNPGNYHYYVSFQFGTDKLTNRDKDAIFEANFNLYNLITLFITSSEIKELANLLIMDDTSFVVMARDEGIKLMYCYYIIGAIGVGKTSTISYFRNLYTHDEWPDFRILELGKDWESLSEKQKIKVNDWIADQFKKKNRTLCDKLYGLHIVDRAPLDPIAFTKPQERQQKADFLISRICDDDGIYRIKSGHIIILTSEPAVLEERARSSGKEYKAKKLEEMQKTLKRIYSSPKVSVVDTKNRNLENVIKDVGRIIHKEEYKEINLHLKLMNIKNGRFKC